MQTSNSSAVQGHLSKNIVTNIYYMKYFVYEIFATYGESQNEIGMAAPKSVPTRRVETTICTVYTCSYTCTLYVLSQHLFQ